MQNPLRPLTYPARPVNGGPLDKAPAKSGDWFYEPKYNGWRALVHTPTGAMFNRDGQRLSIEGQFREALFELKKRPFEWLDCEALERRHSIGKGSLIVLDVPRADAVYTVRRNVLEEHFLILSADTAPGWNEVYVAPTLKLGPEFALRFYTLLQQQNLAFGAEFYEGVVAKRADSIYPVQLRSPKEEFPFWMKHRWAF